MKNPDHGPDCTACHNPGEASLQIASHRAELDTYAARARRHREAGEAAREQLRSTDIGSPEYAEVQERMLTELGDANAIAQSVMFHRAHLDRVEAAHPALRVAMQENAA